MSVRSYYYMTAAFGYLITMITTGVTGFASKDHGVSAMILVAMLTSTYVVSMIASVITDVFVLSNSQKGLIHYLLSAVAIIFAAATAVATITKYHETSPGILSTYFMTVVVIPMLLAIKRKEVIYERGY